MPDNNTLTLIMAATVSVVFAVTFIGIRFVLDRREARLQRRIGDSDSDIVVTKNEDQPVGALRRFDAGFERFIERTGSNIGPAQALALILIAGLVLATALYLIRSQIWMTALGLVIGMAVVLVIFYVLYQRHRRTLQQQLPDAFYLMARSLRAGLSLPQVIELVGEQGAEPLASEFRRCSTQLHLGLALPPALENMAERVQLLDFNAFVSTITMYQSTGGNLAMLLDRLAAGTRDRNQFRGHLRTATALGRITAIGIGSLVPLILLGYAILQPEHIQSFFHTTTGWMMLTVAIVLEVIGAIWLYQILKIEM